MGNARIVRQRYTTPVAKPVVEADWDRQGFTCDWYMATSGRKWVDCSHQSNARIVVVDGRLAVTVDGERNTLGPGDELLVPRQAIHNVENVHTDTSRWLYGFDIAPEKGAS
jgi:mannose-6-phosphate isomerase-like protein (cupin superfamily)